MLVWHFHSTYRHHNTIVVSRPSRRGTPNAVEAHGDLIVGWGLGRGKLDLDLDWHDLHGNHDGAQGVVEELLVHLRPE